MNDTVFDDPGTFVGQLQRGRGIAVTRAAHTAGAPDCIYRCIIEDARWDRQTEERSSYLARLVHRLGLSVAPLEAHLWTAAAAEDVWLTLDVLGILGFAGRSDASDVIRQYAVAGEHWSAAIDALGSTGAWKLPGILDGLAERVVATRNDSELDEAIFGSWEPWSSLGRDQPRIAAILGDRGGQRRPVEPDAESEPADLVARVRAADLRGRRAALSELGRLGDLRLLDLAADRSLCNSAGWTPGLTQALALLGDRAVPAARAWVESDDATLAELGVGVLAEYGEPRDAPVLLNAVTLAARSGAWCALEAPARALGRIGERDAADLLRHLWELTEHSSSRPAILDGLVGCAPEVVEQYASEGLDDCEPAVQQAACGVAPATAAVRSRLTELRDDPLAPEVKEAAAQRLQHSW